jgi:hypothetical protein
MENDQATCPKCRKQIPKANLVLHEAQCKEVCRDNRSENLIDNFESEYTYCQKCDNYVQTQFLTDHELSHQYEQGYSERTGSRQTSNQMVIDDGGDSREQRSNVPRTDQVNRNSKNLLNNRSTTKRKGRATSR